MRAAPRPSTGPLGPLTALALALGLAVGLLTTGPASPAGAAPAGGVLSVPLRVGTYNIPAGASLADLEDGVDAVLPLVDVAGFQEINQPVKRSYLRDLPGWGYYYPFEQNQNPVVWDETTLRFIDGRSVLLAEGRSIGDEKPRAGAYRKDSFATVVHLRHLATGRAVTVVDVHLLAGAVSAGTYRRDRPRMAAFYRDQVDSLEALVAEESPRGTLMVLGDFNVGYVVDERRHRKNLPYARLTREGLVSMWRDCSTDGRGTHGPQYIDQVWSQRPAARCRVAYGIRHSDHYPVVATYALDVLPLS